MKIVELYRYGKAGWEFCIMGKEWYRTDSYGEGLYQWYWKSGYDIEADGTMSKYYDYHLILGCNKFWLPQSYSGAYKKIRRDFASMIDDIKMECLCNDVKK